MSCRLRHRRGRKVFAALLLLFVWPLVIYKIYPITVSLKKKGNVNDNRVDEGRRLLYDEGKRLLYEKTLREKVCRTSLQSNEMLLKPQDYRNFIVKQFLKNFKNPCYYENVSKGVKNGLGTQKVLRCAPYFLIAGFPKAGTTDLFHRLLQHPDIVAKHKKEPMYFNRRRKGRTFSEVAENYMKIFHKTALAIQNKTSTSSSSWPEPYHPAITGEGSVDTAFDNKKWQYFPGNENCSEPVITQVHYLHRINPDIKVIFMIRNPTDMLYSDYIFESRFVHYEISREDFHNSVIKALDRFVACARHNSVRGCAYNIKESYKARLRIGLYHIFIEDWLRVIKPGNVLIISSDSTKGPNKLQVFRQICKFLNIRPLSIAEEAEVYKSHPRNTRLNTSEDIGEMFNETRQLLDAFYKPFNKELSKFNIL